MAFKVVNKTVIDNNTDGDVNLLRVENVPVLVGDGNGNITLQNVILNIDSDSVSEGSNNLYFTDARAQAALAGDIINLQTNIGIGDTNTLAAAQAYADSILVGNLSLSGHIIPSVDSDGTTGFDLGSPSKKWRDLYLSEGSLYINNQKVIEDSAGTIIVRSNTDQSLLIKTEGTGVLTLESDSTINVSSTLQIQSGKRITDSGGNAIQFGDKVDMDNNQIINVGSPTSATDGVNKAYVDSTISTISTNAITEGDSQVEIADLGTGTVIMTVDGAQRFTLSATELMSTVPMKINSDNVATEIYADQAEADAKAYTDTREAAITTAYQTYTDTAEANAVSTSNNYTDQAEADAKAYTDTREAAITTAYEAYADQAEVDAVSTANSYTDTAVANVIDSAPAVLDTLNELAAALGDDANFATTVSNDIGTKVSKTGDTMTGDLTLAGAPSNANHAASKAYVDSAVSGGTGALDTDDIAEAGNLYYTNARVDARIPTNISSFTNDSSYATTSQLFSGSYTDLSNKPTIPTNNNQLTNGASYATTSQLFSGSYDDLSDKPTIPTNNNQLTNGAGYITSFTDTNTTYTAGTGLNLVGTTFNNTAPDQTVSLTGSGATSISGTYPNFTISSTDTNTNTTYSTATSSTLGLVKIGYSENGKNYPVELSSGKMYVNVPWVDTNTDTNTTYSDGNGIGLSSTTFSVSAGNGLTQEADGLKMSGSYTGTFTASGDICAYSDKRLKRNIQTIDNALDTVHNLRGVTFEKSLKPSIGVIAQEVEEVLPELVNTDADGMKSVAYGNIVGVLIEAIKEQQKQIEELKNKFKDL